MRRLLISVPKWSTANFSRNWGVNWSIYKHVQLASNHGISVCDVKGCYPPRRYFSNQLASSTESNNIPIESDIPEDGTQETFREPEKYIAKIIPVETSIRYMKSAAYRKTYGENPVWVLYRRNFKGQYAPKKTRKSCTRKGVISTGNPCPICRDEYLVLDYRNEELLKQFISPFNGEVLDSFKTGICRERHEKLLVEILKAKEHGILTLDVPFRNYDYNEYIALHKSYKSDN